MKRFLFVLLFALFLCSCDLIEKQYYVALSVDTSTDDVSFNNSYISIKDDTTFYLNYFLLPESNKTISVESVISSNPDVIKIISVDKTNKTIEALAQSPGDAKITINTSDYGSSTTLKINVY